MAFLPFPDFLAALAFFGLTSLGAASAAGVFVAVPLAAEEPVPARLVFDAAAVVFRAAAEPAWRVVPVLERRAAVRDAGAGPESAAAIAADMVLAASASDFTAVSIDRVAVLMARSALVMVLAESVALAAAVFSFSAAFVTLVAAAETARGVVALAVLALARRVVVDLRVPVDGAAPAPLALAARRAGFAVAVSVATDLPPHHDQLRGNSFHYLRCFTHSSDVIPIRYAARTVPPPPVISLTLPTM